MTGSLDDATRNERQLALWVLRGKLASAIAAAWHWRRKRAMLAAFQSECVLDAMLERQGRKR